MTLVEDVAAGVKQLQLERGIGVSEAVNELIRAGLRGVDRAAGFVQRTHDLGRGIDHTNIGDAIERLDDPAGR